MMCMVAIYMTPKITLQFLMISFLAGGVLSLSKAFLEKNLVERFKLFFTYLKTCFLCKHIIVYGEKWSGTKRQKKTVIHFSLAIAVSTILWVGGFYS